MSGIALNSFISSARLANDGDVRISQGTDSSLVNKGTFGQKVAQFFSDIGSALGVLRPDADDRALRQEKTFTAFKSALASEYGKATADTVLRDLQTSDGSAPRLTGRAMLEAVDTAREIQMHNTLANLAKTGRWERFDGADLGQFGETLKPPVDPRNFTAAQKDEYLRRMRENVGGMSDGGRNLLTESDIENAAKSAFKQVAKLVDAGGLEDAQKARQAYVDSLKSALRDIAKGGDAGSVMFKFETAMTCYQQHIDAELRSESGANEFGDLTESAMQEAMRDLRNEDPKMLAKLQERTLASDSPLRALFEGVDDAMFTVPITAGAVQSIGGAVVRGLARMQGALTGTTEGDQRRLASLDGTRVDQEALTEANRAFNGKHRSLFNPFECARELYQLNSSGEEHGVDDVRKLVDKHLQGYMASRDVSLERAITDFRAGFNKDLVLPLTLKVVEEHLDALGKKAQ